MKRNASLLAAVVTLGLVVLLAPSPASADTYTYTGLEFTSFFLLGDCHCTVTGYFTAPTLAVNTTTIVSPTSFDFDLGGGGDLFSSTPPPLVEVSVNDFFITTDASGAIVSWFIDISNDVFGELSICSDPTSPSGYSCSSGDAFYFSPPGVGGGESYNATPGSWGPDKTSATPEPAVAELVGVAALAGLLAIAFRRV